MALPYTETNAYVNKYIIPKLVDVHYQSGPVLTRLRTRNAEGYAGGESIKQPIAVGSLWADAIGRGEGVPLDFITTDSAMELLMKLYACNISLYGYDAMTNDGPESVFNQAEVKMFHAAHSLAEVIGQSLWKSSQDPGRSKHLEGFPAWVDDGNLYPAIAGVTRADVQSVGTVGGLNAYSLTTLTALSMNTINTAYVAAWQGPDQVDMIVCTPNGWNLVWQAMQPDKRYMEASNDLAQAGFHSLRFNAADLTVDRFVPTGQGVGAMYGLNSKYITLWFHKNPNFQFGFTGFKPAQGSIDVAAQYLVAQQLMVTNPRCFFKLRNATTSALL